MKTVLKTQNGKVFWNRKKMKKE